MQNFQQTKALVQSVLRTRTEPGERRKDVNNAEARSKKGKIVDEARYMRDEL